MKMKYSALIFLLFIGFGTAANADCNFDRAVGTCEGNVHLVRTGGSAPSFSAELEIKSSAGACSKVEYRIGSNPFTSIIRSSGQEYESLFGTKPVRTEDIEVLHCTAYEGGTPKEGSETAAVDVLTGKWFNGSHEQPTPETTVSSSTLSLVERSGKVSGTATTTVTSVFKYKGRITSPVSSDFPSSLSGTRTGSKVVLTGDDSKQREYRLDGDKLWAPGGDYFKRLE